MFGLSANQNSVFGQTLETGFDHISKHLKHTPNTAACRNINYIYLLGVSVNVVKHGLFFFDITLHDVTGQTYNKPASVC